MCIRPRSARNLDIDPRQRGSRLFSRDLVSDANITVSKHVLTVLLIIIIIIIIISSSSSSSSSSSNRDYLLLVKIGMRDLRVLNTHTHTHTHTPNTI